MTYLVYITFTLVLIIALLVVNYFLSATNLINGDSEKVSPYECGFEPLGDTRQKFNITFYLIGILFIIFDLEVVFILPFATVLQEVSFLGFWVSIIFLVVLTIGFIYEYISGAITSTSISNDDHRSE